MIKTNSNTMLFRHIRLEAATACQLKCPACPTAGGETGKRLGTGFLKFDDFKKVVDENPWVSRIELSNWGEIFLNKDLLKILAYAYKRNVALLAANGTNLNNVSSEVLEGLVKYKLRVLKCSIDGASQKTYVQYRVNGDFDTVIGNIKRINHWKAKYRSEFPKLQWQYIAFGHNEHEIAKARQMAEELNMKFFFKLSWDDLYTKEFSPVRNKDLVRKESGLGVASREEYRQTYGHEFVERKCCSEIWKSPQINFDGRVLGCSINYWGDFGNAFKDGLKETLNNEAITYARDMLKGKVPPKAGIPCTTCKVYHRIEKSGHWVTEEETSLPGVPSRRYIMLENKILGVKGTYLAARLYAYGKDPKKLIRRLSKIWRAVPSVRKNGGTIKSSINLLVVPQEADPLKGWKPYPMISGSTAFTDSFTCHTSVLVPGHCPHSPHEHKDEEILMMLSGGAELNLPGLKANAGSQKVTLQAGQFVYYPAHFFHTLVARGKKPANYLMFKWFGKAVQKEKTLGYGRYDLGEAFRTTPVKAGFNPHLLFEGPTHNLTKLHCHITTLMPGAGYEPHADAYDVAIIVLEGCIETLGKRVEPSSVIFYKAGEPHGVHNPTAKPAKYVVFEFHG